MTITWNRHIQLADICALANGAKLEIAPEAWQRLAAARAVVEAELERGTVAYGLNTGLGSLKKHRLEPEQILDFNYAVVRSHAVALSSRKLPKRLVRATIAARLAGLLQGGSGVRPELVKLLQELLNRQVYPILRPNHTSVGDSDLAPLAQLGLVLIGEGEADYEGQRYTGDGALARAGLTPLTLQAKEGLGLVSAPGYSLGLAALYLEQSQTLLEGFDIAAMYSLEGLGGNPNILNPNSVQGRPFAGQQRRAAHLQRLLEGSDLEQRTSSLQDPTSFRCVLQVHTALDEILEFCKTQFHGLLNSQTDNPVVGENSLHPSGNFDGTITALSSDLLRLAWQRILVMSAQRVNKLGWSSFSGLPSALADPNNPDLGMTLNNVSRSMNTAVARAQTLAQPCSLTITPNITEGTDDYTSMAANGIEMLGEHLQLAQTVLALELVFSNHALRQRDAKPSRAIAAVHRYTTALMSQPFRLQPYLQHFQLSALLESARVQEEAV